MKKLILILMAMPLWGMAQSSLSHIEGLIIDQTTKGSLPGAIIMWEGTETVTISDLDGRFKIPKVDSVEILHFNFTGYQQRKFKITNEHEILVELSPSEELLEVEIKIEKPSTNINMYSNIKIEEISKKELGKAACCNLSESFETNPTVDVSFTDAVTGTKQIQLLGLAGPYSLISNGNLPSLTGNSSLLGLELIPGQWLESIQLIKGTGSVVNGYNSISGQINTEYISPHKADKTFLNLYGNSGSRLELNAIQKFKINDNLAARGFLQMDHGTVPMDNNGDSFMDNQTGSKIVLMNTWEFDSDSTNWENKSGIKLDWIDKQSGQTQSPSPYIFSNNQSKLEVWTKNGFISSEKVGRSFGTQVQSFFDQKNLQFGNRNLNGKEFKFFSNVIFADIIGNTNHKIKSGTSYTYQYLNNSFDTLSYLWHDHSFGLFSEYIFTPHEKFSLVSGLRIDYSSIWNLMVNPRIHGRWEISPNFVFRFSGGKANKAPNPFFENIGRFASSRKIVLPTELILEDAWNYGMNLTRKFKIKGFQQTLSFDLYRTDFSNKMVADLYSDSHSVKFINTRSFANSLMLQFTSELGSDIKSTIAYRWYDVQSQFNSSSFQADPFLPNHRFFINTDYKLKSWAFDFTINWNGKSKLPQSTDSNVIFPNGEYSESYFTLNGQIKYSIKKEWEFYMGGENLLNYQQPNPILNADTPLDKNFDASMIWGPIFGRKIYAGIKLTLK